MGRQERLEKAIKAILPIVAELNATDWGRISALIDLRYSSKAAKVELDGSDLNLLEANLRSEILGELRIIAQSQSEETSD